jgi:phosphoserine phosphatase
MSSDAQHTGLILLTGTDAPGITQALFATLEPFAITVLDIEQVVISDRLILTVLIGLSPAHAKVIESDLAECALKLDVDIATLFSDSTSSSIQAKTGLLHVVALSQKLQPSAISQIATAITQQGGNIERIFRTASYPVTAVEFQVSGASVDQLRTSVALVSREVGIDLAVSPGGLARLAKKLVVMDVDSTLIQQEVIELLAAKVGVEKEVIEITNAAMAGELDFEASLRARVALLAGASEEILDEVRSEIKLTPGARTLVKTLQKLGHEVAVVSGGFTAVIEPILKDLGITHFRANTLEVVGGKLTGRIVGDVIDRAAKATALRDFAKIVGVELEQTIAIGDGANDLDMIAIAGMGIAFNAKPAVKAAADSSVSAPYLDSVLYLLGISREDIEEAGASRK